MTRLSRPPTFSRTIAYIGPLLGRLTIWAKCRALLGARQEIADCRSDLVTVCLEGEVAGVEEAHVSVWNVTLERLGARRQEKRVVLAPSCQKRRLVLAKIGLEFGIQRD